MPLTKTDTGNAIRGLAALTAAQRRDCQDVIAQIDFADLGRAPGTLHTVRTARIDVQGHTAAGDVNIQVQVGANTAAAALIATTVLTVTDPANQRGAAHGAVSVLNQSLDSGTIWNLTGTLP